MIVKKTISFYIEDFLGKYYNKNLLETANLDIDQNYSNSNLVNRINKIIQKSIIDLTTEDIAVLLRQKIGGSFLLAIALMIIVEEPFIKAENYAVDLLNYCLEYSWSEWLEIEVYNIDPYDTIASIEFAVIGIEKKIDEYKYKYKLIGAQAGI